MNITPQRLGQAAGLSAAAAGAIFIAVQINHPPMDLQTVATAQWAVRSCAKMMMAALVLVGITGLYLRQFRQIRVLGLIGYLLFAMGYLTMFGVELVAAAVLPAITETAPAYVTGVLTAAAGGTPAVDIGLMQTVLTLSGIGYMLGGLLFGIALFRAGIVAKWAAALLAAGTISTLALAVLPEAFNRFLALPVGVALLGLGLSLWNDQRRGADSGDAPAPMAKPEPAQL